MKLNNDAIMVQPCPVHGRKPELLIENFPHLGQSIAQYVLRCPVPGCVCEADYAPTRTLAMEEWDAMAYGLSGRDGTPEFPLLALEAGDNDEADPFDPADDEEA